MATITKIEELEIWQMARAFAKMVGDTVVSDKFMYEAILRNQIKNASGSIMDNIAEGFGRASRNEFVHHLTIARGSAQETKSQLFRCHDLGLVDDHTYRSLLNQFEMLIKRISGLINYLTQTPYKGPKFKAR
jgi:four helix bundle protein